MSWHISVFLITFQALIWRIHSLDFQKSSQSAHIHQILPHNPAIYVGQQQNQKTCSNNSITPKSNGFCCDGYRPSTYNASICEPICLNHCHNGYCAAPGKCECYPGYVRNNGGFCIPTCPIDCPNGYCLPGGICQCKSGYHLDANRKFCQPQCKLKCWQFSYCAMTDICDCVEGYYQSTYGKCSPICNSPCGDGKCVRPNVCVCSDSATLFNGTCVRPNCPRGCLNGTCIGDNICSCHLGFTLSGTQSNKCEPVCKNGCQNGYCSAPDKCICNSGYKMIGNECKPICKEPCINGECVAPDACDCNPGYYIPFKHTNKNHCKPYCRNNCKNGYCAAPDRCACNRGYDYIWGECRKPMFIFYQPLKNYNITFASPSILSSSSSSPSLSLASPLPSKSFGGVAPGGNCTQNCLNGVCIGNNVCSCNAGYVQSPISPFICIASCPKGCYNGECIAPNLCACKVNFVKINENTCVQ